MCQEAQVNRGRSHKPMFTNHLRRIRKKRNDRTAAARGKRRKHRRTELSLCLRTVWQVYKQRDEENRGRKQTKHWNCDVRSR